MLALVLLICQISLGGWTSSNYAALACPDLPTCQGRWWPPMDFGRGFDVGQEIGPNYLGGQMDGEARVAIHMAHRIGAILVTAVIGFLIFRLYKHAGNAEMKRLTHILTLCWPCRFAWVSAILSSPYPFGSRLRIMQVVLYYC